MDNNIENNPQSDGLLNLEDRPTNISKSANKASKAVTLADLEVKLLKTPYEIYAESSIGGRKENQDYYTGVETPYGILIIVCDGMGGANGGAIASKLTADTILERVSKYHKFTTPRELLINVIMQANSYVYNYSKNDPNLKGMGTTIVALLLNDEKVTVAHVGDSRLYQIRKGKIAFRTTDHSMVAELVKKGELTEEQARTSNISNVILQAIGTKPNVENIEIDEDISFTKGDRFLLCTDGIWGAVPERELLNLATTNKSVKATINNMVTSIDNIGKESGNGHDNLTAIILEVKGDSSLKEEKKPRKNIWIYITILSFIAIFVAITTYFICGDKFGILQIFDKILGNK